MNLEKKPTPEQLERKLYYVETTNIVLVVIVACLAFPLVMLWNVNSSNKELIQEYQKQQYKEHGLITTSPVKEIPHFTSEKVIRVEEKRAFTEVDFMQVRLEACTHVASTYRSLVDRLLNERK